MIDTWQYSTTHRCACQVIEEVELWGTVTCRVWLPDQDAVVRVPKATLTDLQTTHQPEAEALRIGYIASAAKVAEVLEAGTSGSDDGVLLAPMESNVIPLPHQIYALSRAISSDRIRYLLADEVGLGKTIEAGLIMRELKLRGLVQRTLVVAPKGLATQWVSEMDVHFSEKFQLVNGEDISTLRRFAAGTRQGSTSHWSLFDQVVVSLDSVKPVDRRRGWTPDRIAEYNRDRYEELVTAGWDLVIVDEAHRLGGSTDQVARYRLGQGLAEAAPYVLLLSATPHQGKSDAFHRLVSLLDSQAFLDSETVTRERVAPFVIRTEKRKAIDADGKPLFKPRRTTLVPIVWEPRHRQQQLLYEAVTEYVKEGYNQALLEKKRHIGFLMILMQRLVVSSTRAIKTTLERRMLALEESAQQTLLQLDDVESGGETEALEELYDLDGQELLDEMLKLRIAAMHNEKSFVETLLKTAEDCERAGADAKAEALLEWVYKLQAEESDTDLKVLIFTEFVPTQKMLQEFLEARGVSVVTLNGSMDMDERKRVQDAFRSDARVLISTDAGGEGLNLQFCHVIINYDLPWNPMRLEQRIGRVDRIGQSKVVRALNFVFEESVEFRVREVLEEKLAIIFEQFGIDKTGDVLDSAEAGEIFEEAFTAAILNPESIETSVNTAVERVRREIQEVSNQTSVYAVSDEPDPIVAERLKSHPLPHWIERMTINYLHSHGGSATKRVGWNLTWPDGHVDQRAVFSARDAEEVSDATVLNLEKSRIRGLALNLPLFAEGQLIPKVRLKELPPSVAGFWGLFEVRLHAGEFQENRLVRLPSVRRAYIPAFLNHEQKVFLPTARHIWDLLLTGDPEIVGFSSAEVHSQLLRSAYHIGEEAFAGLRQLHDEAIKREEERGVAAFAAKRKAHSRIGLPEVRNYRLKQVDTEEAEWRRELDSARVAMPDVKPLLMLEVSSAGAT